MKHSTTLNDNMFHWYVFVCACRCIHVCICMETCKQYVCVCVCVTVFYLTSVVTLRGIMICLTLLPPANEKDSMLPP